MNYVNQYQLKFMNSLSLLILVISVWCFVHEKANKSRILLAKILLKAKFSLQVSLQVQPLDFHKHFK